MKESIVSELGHRIVTISKPRYSQFIQVKVHKEFTGSPTLRFLLTKEEALEFSAVLHSVVLGGEKW